jgi:hypothetical protein
VFTSQLSRSRQTGSWELWLRNGVLATGTCRLGAQNHDTDRVKDSTFGDSLSLTGFKEIVIGRLSVIT